MDKKEKSDFTSINKNLIFRNIIRKLTIGDILNFDEKSYILNCAIVFIRYYEADKRYKSYLEMGYYILLKYSVQYEDYLPLYEFSMNFGFYPISKNILDNKLIEIKSLNDYLESNQLERYKKENYFETLEQHLTRLDILNSDKMELSFVAPTSYGKSAIIMELIKKYGERYKKIAIIVPTKSLLRQTFKMIKEHEVECKIITHDEMYQGESSFIAVVTQERALRLLNKYNIYFDIMFIDEAHKLMVKGYRSIMLSRIILKNKILNDSSKYVYLSPLVSSSDNLKILKEQKICEFRIDFNVKEPEIYEYTLDNICLKYNRFVNEFYDIGSNNNYIQYIKKRLGLKNFIYIRNPKKIERFSNQFYESLEDIELTPEIMDLINILSEQVHEFFYGVKLLKKGIVYIHGKMPDLIKEYLEEKFSKISQLKYIIANTVILEGMNLPIDTLFIMNVYSLNGKELTNLIGRVNRLNTVFSMENNRLEKLLPQIHFVNTEIYNRKDSNMSSKIKLLRNRIFNDLISNPVLDGFDFDSLKISKDRKAKAKEQINETLSREAFLSKKCTTKLEEFKKSLIESGVDGAYEDIDYASKIIFSNISKIREMKYKFKQLDVIDKINEVFVGCFDKISDFEVDRLREEKARDFYKMHIDNMHRYSLKENISKTYGYYESIKSSKNRLLYVGESYGEVELQTNKYKKRVYKVYIDLYKANKEKLVNIAIVKIKMENSFVSFKISRFVNLLFDYELIEENEYHNFFYGTTEKKSIELIKLGISSNLIRRLDSDIQMGNLYFDKYNNIQCNNEFIKYKSNVDDFTRFEIERFL